MHDRVLYRLTWLALAMSLGHHLDHLIRHNAVGWPLTGEVNAFARVQREEDSLRAAQRWARQAHRNATWALWASGVGLLLLAAIALVTG